MKNVMPGRCLPCEFIAGGVKAGFFMIGKQLAKTYCSIYWHRMHLLEMQPLGLALLRAASYNSASFGQSEFIISSSKILILLLILSQKLVGLHLLHALSARMRFKISFTAEKWLCVNRLKVNLPLH